MLYHIVRFWLNSDSQKAESKSSFEHGLNALVKIPLCETAHWGTPAPVPPRKALDNSWDYTLILAFDNVATHDEYQVDKQHQAFLSEFKSYWERVEVVDSLGS